MHTIWFIHAPRTGGMSFASYLGNLRRAGRIHIRHQPHEKFTWSVKKLLLVKTPDLKVVTILRDPVQQTISLFSYANEARNRHRDYPNTQRGFNYWLTHSKEIPNYYAKFYGHGSVEKAIENLRGMIRLNTATLNRDVNALMRRLGIKKPFGIHKNSFKRPHVGPQDIVVIKEIRRSCYDVLAGCRQ